MKCQGYNCQQCVSNVNPHCIWDDSTQTCSENSDDLPAPTTCLECQQLPCSDCAGQIDRLGKVCAVDKTGTSCTVRQSINDPVYQCQNPTVCDAVSTCTDCYGLYSAYGSCYIQPAGSGKVCSAKPSSVTTCNCFLLSATDCIGAESPSGKCELIGSTCVEPYQKRVWEIGTVVFVIFLATALYLISK